MELPGEQTELMDAILLLERMIDQMHAQFDNYRHGEIHVLPDWQRFERQLLFFPGGGPIPWNFQISWTGSFSNSRREKGFG